MKYTININQFALRDDDKISISEAGTLTWIRDFCASNSRKINANKVDGWVLVRPQYLVDDMPLLRIKTRAGGLKLLRRIEELGYIKMKTEARKTYLKTTEKMDRLWFEDVNSRKPDVNSSIQDVNQSLQRCKPEFTYPNTNHNTNPNTISITPEVSGDSKEKDKVVTSLQLPKERGKSYILRVISIYKDLFEELYGFRPVVSIPRYGKQIKELAFLKSEIEIASLLIVFFDWHGVDGRDDFEREKLVKAQHPLGWFFASVNSYEAHLRNVAGIDPGKEDEIRAFVAKRMLSIKK